MTERGQFRTCRRRWYLQTLESLEPKLPQLALCFGTGIHKALEVFYGSNRNEAKMLVAFEDWYVEENAKWEKGGIANEADLFQLYEMSKLGIEMLENYVKYDKVSKVKLGVPLAVEGVWRKGKKPKRIGPPKGYPKSAEVVLSESGRLLVPIVHPLTKEPVESGACMSGKIDLLTERATPKKGLWVVDYKTATSASSELGVDFDDQITGYDYTVWRWTGQIPRGVVYNYLIKSPVKEPRYSEKQEKLSAAKDQLTTPDEYRKALKAEGLIKGGRIIGDKYAECLDALLARGWDPWFKRYEVTRNLYQMERFEEHLWNEHVDMMDVKKDEKYYPNPQTFPFQVCQRCPVNRICLAMEDGSDVQGVIETNYQEAEDRKAV